MAGEMTSHLQDLRSIAAEASRLLAEIETRMQGLVLGALLTDSGLARSVDAEHDAGKELSVLASQVSMLAGIVAIEAGSLGLAEVDSE